MRGYSQKLNIELRLMYINSLINCQRWNNAERIVAEENKRDAASLDLSELVWFYQVLSKRYQQKAEYHKSLEMLRESEPQQHIHVSVCTRSSYCLAVQSTGRKLPQDWKIQQRNEVQ